MLRAEVGGVKLRTRPRRSGLRADEGEETKGRSLDLKIREDEEDGDDDDDDEEEDDEGGER